MVFLLCNVRKFCDCQYVVLYLFIIDFCYCYFDVIKYFCGVNDVGIFKFKFKYIDYYLLIINNYFYRVIREWGFIWCQNLNWILLYI